MTSDNKEKVLNFYKNISEDTRFNVSRSANMEFHYTKKILTKYISANSNIIELGCATGNYGMYFADKCEKYTGVDISEKNLLDFQSKINAENKTNISTIMGDATNLSEIESNSFDVVMCLGPMYHLDRAERGKVSKECFRIAKTGGIIAFAYVNRIGVYVGACVDDETRKIYPNAEATKCVFEDNTGDVFPGVFFFTSPEEMEYDAKLAGFDVVENCGVDFLFAASAIDKMDDEKFEYYTVIADKMSESKSCTGLANHALLVCKK